LKEADQSGEGGKITPEIGGSNYAYIELGRYANDPTEENWASDVKTPVVHLQDYRMLVEEQLLKMKRNGQDKIALIVWFSGPNLNCDFHMHTVCPQNGKMPSLARRNLQEMIGLLHDLKFSEVQIRLGGQGSADVHYWKKFEEDIYQSNSSFVMDVVAASEEALAGKSLVVFYDLGLELMGHPHMGRAWYYDYLKRLWGLYLQKYPVSKSIGFSFNHADFEATILSLRLFDQSQFRPPRLGLDIYLNPEESLRSLTRALKTMNWPKDTQIFIQETYRNDSYLAEIFSKAKVDLNIRTIVQWPIDRLGPGHANSTDYNFENYR
jgi:hypothetical protein